MGTRLDARSSDGGDLNPFWVGAGAGALVSRSPLSARSTDCGLIAIPSVLGKEGKEIKTIEQSAVATIARRNTSCASAPPIPESSNIKRSESFFVPPNDAIQTYKMVTSVAANHHGAITFHHTISRLSLVILRLGCRGATWRNEWVGVAHLTTVLCKT